MASEDSKKDEEKTSEEESEKDSAATDEEQESSDDESEEEAPKKKAGEKAGEKKAGEKTGEKKTEKKPERKLEPVPRPKAPEKKPWVNFFPPRPAPKPPEVITEKKPALVLAEFDSAARLMHAAERMRDAGYTRWDTHSPFPIHGMDAAMGLPDSKLGWIVLCGGLTGLTTAVTMIWWMNGVDYPIIIGGKPPFSLPPSVPIMFELTILFSAFSAVFGMFGLNRIPQHHHPIFESERFRGATDDRFYISVEVEDPKYHPERTKALLEKLHPTHIEIVEETETKVVGHAPDEDH